MTSTRLFALAAAVAFAYGALDAAELATKRALTLEIAKEMSAAAETEAVRNNWNVVIAIVDDGGRLMHLVRRDGTQYGSIEVAQDKARTAIAFRRPTKAFEDVVAAATQFSAWVAPHPSRADYRSSSTAR
jgi:uncharacterized protein GlcG (DUF336 family)